MSTAWEDSLYDFLDSKNISYVNEQTFKDAGNSADDDDDDDDNDDDDDGDDDDDDDEDRKSVV